EEGEEGLRRVDLLDRRFTNGEPIRDISQAWGMPSQNVHNLYRKARGEFQESLREVVKRHANTTTDLDGECRRLLGLL
ncbi:MAG: sigma-70 family RNA polymerase sigma factor, partial [Planctomycetota bacterium]